MEKKEEKVTLIKGKEKREFSKAAAEIAMDHFGWTNLPTPPPEILKGTGPIPLKRKIEPPVITDLKSDPEFANMPEDYIERNQVPVEQRPGYEPEVIEKPKPKRPTRKK